MSRRFLAMVPVFLLTFFAARGIYGEMKDDMMKDMKMGEKEGMMMGPLMPGERVEMMKKMMMEMAPDTLEASLDRGKKLFNDTALGNNLTGTSCATCHPGGKTTGGASEMEWKGQTMKVAIPT